VAPAKKQIPAKTKKTVKAAVKKPAAKKVVVKKTAVKSAIVKKPIAKKAAAKTKAPKGIPEQLLDAALKVLDERQAEEIVTVPLIGRSSVADYMILASGRAGRQVSAIADYLREAFFKLGVRQVRIEGMSEANWVLIDAGDVIIHLFRPEVRRYYDLDAIWNDTHVQK
jgi:ribosome-associated protein